MQIVDRLKEIQGEMSVREFARALDVGSSTIHGYLCGRTPPVEIVVRVCERFNISPWWLMTGEGAKTRKKVAEIERIMDALDKNALAMEMVKLIVEMDEVELRALLGLADYHNSLRKRHDALDGVVRCLDMILERLSMPKYQNVSVALKESDKVTVNTDNSL